VPGKIVSCTALPADVTLIAETTWAVGLPSASSATHSPANFLSRSRAACFGGVGSLISFLSCAPAHAVSASNTNAPHQKPRTMGRLLPFGTLLNVAVSAKVEVCSLDEISARSVVFMGQSGKHPRHPATLTTTVVQRWIFLARATAHVYLDGILVG
jgi:hypothetical protein